MIEIEFYDHYCKLIARHFIYCNNDLGAVKRYLIRMELEFKCIAYEMVYRGIGMSRSYITGNVV